MKVPIATNLPFDLQYVF